MAALVPGIVLLLHDVAVRASGRIVLQIRPPLGVRERVSANAEGQSEGRSHHRSFCDSSTHADLRLNRISVFLGPHG